MLSVKAKIGAGLMQDLKSDQLNLAKYATHTSLIEPTKMRAALIETI